jgi:hypothetical protein
MESHRDSTVKSYKVGDSATAIAQIRTRLLLPMIYHEILKVPFMTLNAEGILKFKKRSGKDITRTHQIHECSRCCAY